MSDFGIFIIWLVGFICGAFVGLVLLLWIDSLWNLTDEDEEDHERLMGRR